MSQGSSIRGVDGSAAGLTSTPIKRSCTVCGDLIPQKRLQARPNATKCVPCLEANGDVPLLKRFDEYTANGDRVETLFTEDPLLEAHIEHLLRDVPSDAAYDAALGTTTEIDPRETEQIIQSVTEDEELNELIPPLDAELEILLDESDDEDLDQHSEHICGIFISSAF